MAKEKQQVKRITILRDYENGELVSEYEEIEYVTDEPEQLELELDSEDSGLLEKDDTEKSYPDYYRHYYPFHYYWTYPPQYIYNPYYYTTTWNNKTTWDNK